MSESTLPTNNSTRAIDVDDRGEMQYRSGAETGHVEITIPALPGSPNATERLHVRDFGIHVASKIEGRMNAQPYLKSGPQQSPHQIFRHYTAVMKGAGVMGVEEIGRMETLANEFEREPEKREYFRQVVKPYLIGLTPQRRQP